MKKRDFGGIKIAAVYTAELLDQNAVLGLKVIIKIALGYSGKLRDISDGHAVVIELVKKLDGAAENGVFRFLGIDGPLSFLLRLYHDPPQHERIDSRLT